MAEIDSVSCEIAPRSAHTGQNSLFSFNAVPQTSQARLPSVFSPSSLSHPEFSRFGCGSLHKSSVVAG
jgi:hypothetical protein